MQVLYYSADLDHPLWVPALQAALPGAEVRQWVPGAAPADYAVLWKPPQPLLDEQPQLKAIAQIAGKMVALERGQPVAGKVNPLRGY